MRLLACFVLLAVAACNAKQTATKQDTVAPAKPAKDPWEARDGSAAVPKWATDPPAVLRDKINGVNAHVIVLKSSPTFAEYREVLAIAERTPGVVAAAPFIFVELEIAKAGRPPVSLALKGVDPGRVDRVLTVGRHMKAGTLASLGKGDPPSIILGDDLARTLDVNIGDEVTVTPPEDAPAGKPKGFRVSGLFHMDFDEYDERLALAPLSAVQAMLARGDQVLGIEMTVKNLDHSDQIAKALEGELGGPPYVVMDWYKLNEELFTALFGERRP